MLQTDGLHLSPSVAETDTMGSAQVFLHILDSGTVEFKTIGCSGHSIFFMCKTVHFQKASEYGDLNRKGRDSETPVTQLEKERNYRPKIPMDLPNGYGWSTTEEASVWSWSCGQVYMHTYMCIIHKTSYMNTSVHIDTHT